MKKISFVIISLFFTYCGGPSGTFDEIEGKYKFKYPTGQVEIIDMKKDQSYNQKIYATESDYLKGAEPLYNNSSNWYTADKELNFNHWLVYCYHDDPDSILAQPYYATMLNIYYHAPAGENHGRIDFYLENGYVFKKIDN